MERLRNRVFMIAGLLLLWGAVVALTPHTSEATPKTEQWLEENSPRQVGAFHMVPSHEGHERVTYKMDESTYEVLAPYGIVARRFEHADQSYDVVLIASNKKTSFHDPRICFRAQGWEITSEETTTVDTVRGPVPMTIAKMVGPDKRKTVACFFYRDGDKYFASSPELGWDIFVRQLKGRNDLDGVFYRFIPLHDGATTEQLKDFIRLYVKEAKDASGGYF